MSIARHHAEWLSLVPVSGPFLSLPVLMEAFPQGLDAHDAEHARLLRLAYEEWDEATGASGEGRRTRNSTHHDPRTTHHDFIKFVLTKTLEYDESQLAEGQAIPQTLQVEVPEHGELLRPNIVLNDPATKKARLLIQTYPRSQDLTSYVAGSRWKASPETRMTDLLHGTGVRLGLVTNGEHWMLVDAPKGETTGYASWYASLWLEEKITLQAFRSLLSMARFFGVPDDQTIESLLTKSASNQQEVTDQLGAQVLRAVEVLIQSLDKADQDHGRELLEGVPEAVLYESALTVMMRLVFLFCAEERELIPTKPFPVYEQNYSVSTISKQLREIADQHGEELLERRYDAWPRLLSSFRAVYGGLAHDDVYMPAYGGRLFDPDRFPFLEGRKQGTTWREGRGTRGEGREKSASPLDPNPTPLPIHNRTVLHLLEALQLLQVKVPGGGPAEARRLSFRSLDIEQIGHVYEGLLDHTAKRATEPMLGLLGRKEPEIPLQLLERERAKGEKSFYEFLNKETGSNRQWERYLDVELDDQQERRLRTACGNDDALFKRVKPFAGLVRTDTFGYPVVIPTGSVFVTAGTDRRSSGTHYTPRSLTEPIVQYTLEPLVYVGPAEGKPKAEWKLKSAAELLDLKICDMACGSGAFLVQAARYMSERLMEAWDEAERDAGFGNRGSGGKKDDGAELSGFGGVEAGDGLGDGMLSSHEDISEGRAIRDDEPEQEIGSFNPGEHRRRSRETAHKGVSQSPEYRSGVADGSPDSSPVGSASGTTKERRHESIDATLRTDQPDDLPPSSGPRKTHLTRFPNPAPPSSFSPGPRTPVPGPRITPEGLPATGAANEQLIPSDPHERRLYAMRIIVQRCLYGVDINPLAVEMAKLSLWLLTLAKDKPFEFLDHSIRCGDSLVGLHDLEQLRHFSLKPDADDAVLFKGPLENAVDEAIKLRLKLEDMPSNTVEDVEAQEKLLKEAEDKIARLRCAADLLVAGEFWGEGTKDKQEKVRHAAVVAGHYVENGPTEEFEEKAEEERRGQKMFHWPLEFPEVIVKRGGFDAFVGNPPFMGGQRITGNLGNQYRDTLVEHLAGGQRGSSDLCAYFFLRAGRLLHRNGHLGLISTNTIAQGDTREVGLDQLLRTGFSITQAVSSFKWPGYANLEAATVWMCRTEWNGAFLLDERQVEGITANLTKPGTVSGKPFRLKENSNRAFQGTTVLGMGFVIEHEEAAALINRNASNADVIFPYLNGIDLNSRSDQTASRSVINFFDWPLDKRTAPAGYDGPVADDYPDCLAIVRERVKPERDANTYSPRARENWWLYERSRGELYSSIAGLPTVLASTRVTKYFSVSLLPNNGVFSVDLAVYASNSLAVFSCLSSSLFQVWIRETSSTMKHDIRFSISDSFETFPFVKSVFDQEAGELSALCATGTQYLGHRATMMSARKEGLTTSYNRFHDPDESAGDINKLRELHVEIDQAVAAAYGWDDLDLGHGFHETKQGIRFTISEPARREVLQRLLKLNHERYAEEVKQGLHDKKKNKAKKTGTPKKSKKSQPVTRMLFGDDDDDEGG